MQTEFAPAKINLNLHITGKTANGYHLLESLVVFVDIGDTVSATLSDSLTLQISGNPDLSNSDNSVLHAARLLQKSQSHPNGAALTLVKHLPVGAGIGGGSADAAATLRLLARLWECALNAINPLSLGADVPVCLESKTAFMRGIGEILDYHVNIPEVAIVLVNPGKTLMTQTVFSGFNSSFSTGLPSKNQFADRDALCAYLHNTGNDLQKSAIVLMPEIETILSLLKDTQHCLFARMSGSGATCFGLYATLAQATQAMQYIQQQHPEWWVKAGKIL